MILIRMFFFRIILQDLFKQEEKKKEKILNKKIIDLLYIFFVYKINITGKTKLIYLKIYEMKI